MRSSDLAIVAPSDLTVAPVVGDPIADSGSRHSRTVTTGLLVSHTRSANAA